jgi:hypothetical protein
MRCLAPKFCPATDVRPVELAQYGLFSASRPVRPYRHQVWEEANLCLRILVLEALEP